MTFTDCGWGYGKMFVEQNKKKTARLFLSLLINSGFKMPLRFGKLDVGIKPDVKAYFINFSLNIYCFQSFICHLKLYMYFKTVCFTRHATFWATIRKHNINASSHR